MPHYLSIFWAPLDRNPWDIVGGIIVILVLVLLNIVGVQEATRVSVVLAVVDFATQLFLVVLGFVLVVDPHILTSNVHWGVAPTWSNLAIAIPVAMLAYTGVETVSNLAEEARDPSRSVPAAYKLVAGAVFAIYFTLPLVALSAMPVTRYHGGWSTELARSPEQGGHANDPVLGIVDNLGVHGQTLHLLQIYVGLLAATILFIATNAGVIGASRITYSMATYRQMPGDLPAPASALQDAVARHRPLRRDRADLRDPARERDVRRHALLVRRHALVHRCARVDRGAPPQDRIPISSTGRNRTSASPESTGRSSRSPAASRQASPSSSSSSRTRPRAGSASPGSSPASSAMRSTVTAMSTCR